MNTERITKYLTLVNRALSEINAIIEDPLSSTEEVDYAYKMLEMVRGSFNIENLKFIQDALKEMHGTLHESSFRKVFHLYEGGKRRHIPQATRDKFIHSLLLIPDSQDRQDEIDSIFEEIKEKNTEKYFEAHPELKKEQEEEE